MYKGCYYKHQVCVSAPHARDCWEVCQLGVTPFLWSALGLLEGVCGEREDIAFEDNVKKGVK